jgi:hypothetical protein
MQVWRIAEIAFAFAALTAVLAGQDPPVRVDFEGRLEKRTPAPPAARPTDPPVRVDFEGRRERSTGSAPSARPTGAPVRVDFEGRLTPGTAAAAAGAVRPMAPGAQSPRDPASTAPTVTRPLAPLPPTDSLTVTGIQPTGCVRPQETIQILGRGFGGSGRVVLISSGAQIPLTVTGWTETRITARIPADNRLSAGNSYLIGVAAPQGAVKTSNVAASICR